MNERKVVNIQTGKVFTPPYLAERRGYSSIYTWEWRGEDELRKDGTPHAGRHGHSLGVWKYGNSWSGQFAFYEPVTEGFAAAIRARIAKLKEQLGAAEDELFGLYGTATNGETHGTV